MKVNVKWGKQLFKDVEVDMDEPPEQLKMQLFSLSGVPVERQKIMGKGGMLQNESWGKVTLKEGQTIMMMGTADELPKAATDEAVKFIEDLPEEEQEAADTKQYGAGLTNMGNTCYANACLQCLYAVPELREALDNAPSNGTGSALASQTSQLFKQMSKGLTVTPMLFLMTLRSVAPQFDQMGDIDKASGTRVHKQQDAEECWNALMNSWRPALRSGSSDPIRELFGVDTTAELKCTESDETFTESASDLMIKCNINSEVNHLSEGIKLALVADREKTSEALGRLAVWQGASKVARLPPYLTVQSMRFYYKAATQSRAKIMRKVTFPLLLDMFEHCTPELQAQLRGPRRAFKVAEDARLGITASADNAAAAADNGAAAAATAGAGASARAAPPADETDADGDETMGTNADAKGHAGEMTGRFELIAVLTHRGRGIDSGHYIGWVKQAAPNTWIQFDDDKLIPRKDEDITALCGGGDWHTAYLKLYRAQRVPEAAEGGDKGGEMAKGENEAAAMEVEAPSMDAPPATAP